ncbi:6-phosphogluconolactonase, cycloisomerase 2 family [Chryseobacterium arachidis]|uniref:6-phosphogluconolactonase, cycloisomerase 2 family n=1 Tax=Chryseobacterium arachidis TaxID=1416778 RepID=A0A1M4UFE7_9FLAO|nr:lactonase family protein [Chryseobacterium arachidis]SHE55313.1 6-phosphogluconolactonase, cycloisomerase 2 family [Chryseobacterium arachidis]
MKKILFLALAVFACHPLYSQKTYAFFGSYNWDKETEGIYVYELDTIKGNLSKVTSFSGISNPSFLTLSPDGKYIFACTESKTKNGGSVSSFEFNRENKTLKFINRQKSGGENPVYLTAHRSGKWLVNGNYTEGSVSVYPISENGKIEAYIQNFQFTEGSINSGRQERAHIHSTVFSPDFNYLFLPDLGADKIRAYQFDNKKAQPLSEVEIPFSKTIPGSGPRHLSFHPNGKFAYCIEEMGGAVSVYSYKDGTLNNLQRINTHSEKYKNDFESSDVHISPDGKFLYASNRGNENNIAIFSIQNDGTLKTIGYQSVKGRHPRTFSLDPSGKFLITANTLTSNVTVFKRNAETGLLKKVGKNIKIKNVTNVQIRKY